MQQNPFKQGFTLSKKSPTGTNTFPYNSKTSRDHSNFTFDDEMLDCVNILSHLIDQIGGTWF